MGLPFLPLSAIFAQGFSAFQGLPSLFCCPQTGLAFETARCQPTCLEATLTQLPRPVKRMPGSPRASARTLSHLVRVTPAQGRPCSSPGPCGRHVGSSPNREPPPHLQAHPRGPTSSRSSPYGLVWPHRWPRALAPAFRLGGWNQSRVKVLAVASWDSHAQCPTGAPAWAGKCNSTFTQGNTWTQKCSRLSSPDFMITGGRKWVTAGELGGRSRRGETLPLLPARMSVRMPSWIMGRASGRVPLGRVSGWVLPRKGRTWFRFRFPGVFSRYSSSFW